jgi:hypothetical protein
VQSDRTGKDGQPITYVVARDATGHFACSCPAWKFQRGSRDDCKHIASIRRLASLESALAEASDVNISVSLTPDQRERLVKIVSGGRDANQPETAKPAPSKLTGKVRRKFRFGGDE